MYISGFQTVFHKMDRKNLFTVAVHTFRSFIFVALKGKQFVKNYTDKNIKKSNIAVKGYIHTFLQR